MTIATRRPPGPLLLSAVSSDDKNKNNNKKSHNTDVSPSSRQDSFSLENSTPKWPERVFLGLWITALSSLILVNNFVGPWPQAFLWQVPERTWLVTHLLGGMLFGGAIVLTTFIEALVVWSGDKGVQKFWYDKVSWLNAGTVVPGLTAAMVSGVGLSVHHYGGLAEAPKHVIATLHTLTTFGLWWAVTDLTTQGKAKRNKRAAVASRRTETELTL